MKKILMLLLCLLLLASLCACGGETSSTEPPAAETKAPATEAPVETTQPVQTTEAVAVTEAATEAEQDMVELVRSYIDKPIEDLYAVIGEPQSSDYASSCLGDGEDGLLIYDGFVVYTYREGDTETVYDVE